MDKKIDFTDETKDSIIAEQEALGLRLKEEQRYTNGNHLIFTDEPYIESEPIRDPLAEIDKLKADYDTLKAKVDILEKK